MIRLPVASVVVVVAGVVARKINRVRVTDNFYL